MSTGLRLLVVDDDPEVLQGTVRVLTRAGYEVFQASSGKECLKLAQAHRPNLILLDVVLPDADGVDVCSQLKRDPELSEIFVIMMSGMRTSSDDQAIGLEQGADGYVARPVGNRELLARVRAFGRLREAHIEQLRVEDRLRQAVKAEGLAVMAGGLAHLLNNRLVGLLGYLDFAFQSLPPSSPARQDLAMAQGEAEKAAEIGRLMLVYTGKGFSTPQVFDLRKVTEEAASGLRPSALNKVKLEVELGETPVLVRGDVAQVRNAIHALLTNALEALESGCGTVSVTTCVRMCSARYLESCSFCERPWPGPYGTVSVVDSGEGMDGATLARSFDPFFTTRFTGRGLGLATVLGVAKQHQGAIHATSTPGSGSTLVLLLPIADEQVYRESAHSGND